MKKAANSNGTSLRERNVLQLGEMKGVGDLKRVLTSDMELQSLEFAQQVFGLALVQYFLTMFPFPHFRMVMYILCHYMLEVCNLLYYFDFTGDYISEISQVSEETLNFGSLNRVGTVKDYRDF